jgi:hypothetical protein
MGRYRSGTGVIRIENETLITGMFHRKGLLPWVVNPSGLQIKGVRFTRLLKNEMLSPYPITEWGGCYFHSHILSWYVPSGVILISKTSATLLSRLRAGDFV